MARSPVTPATIVASAAELADEDGFETIVASAVARRLGIRTASLYAHVRDRAAILAGVQTLAMRELADAVGEAVAGRSRRDALLAMGDAQRAYARRAPGRWEALQRRAEVGVPRSPEAARVAALSLAVLRGYGLAEDDVVHAVRMTGATVSGFIGLERTGAFDHRAEDVETSWRRAIDALDTTFTNWAEAPR